jgi:hypothetical protein
MAITHIRQGPGRWGAIGESMGQGLGQGMETSLKQKYAKEGIDAVVRAVQGGAQTPAQLMGALEGLSNPYAHQAAMQMVQNIMPQMKPQLVPPGHRGVSPMSGEQTIDPEYAPTDEELSTETAWKEINGTWHPTKFPMPQDPSQYEQRTQDLMSKGWYLGDKPPVVAKQHEPTKLGKLLEEQSNVAPGSKNHRAYEQAIEKEIERSEGSKQALTQLGKYIDEKQKHRAGTPEYTLYDRAITALMDSEEAKKKELTTTEIRNYEYFKGLMPTYGAPGKEGDDFMKFVQDFKKKDDVSLALELASRDIRVIAGTPMSKVVPSYLEAIRQLRGTLDPENDVNQLIQKYGTKESVGEAYRKKEITRDQARELLDIMKRTGQFK